MKNRVLSNLIWISAFSSLILLSSCMKHEDPKTAEELLQESLARVDQAQLQADIAVIDDSLQKWSINAQTEPNGVRYKVVTQGTGPMPTLKNNIVFNYKGSLLKNRSVFEQGNNVPYALRDLIVGWQTTLPLVNKGSKVILYIPSGLAYAGAIKYDRDGNVSIPANSNLIFEIDLLDVY